MKLVYVILLVFSTGLVAAQGPAITPDMPVDTATLHRWLRSGDPRLIAWSADFAHRKHDAAILAEMPDWLEHWTMPPLVDDEAQQASRTAVLAVLDALIQENVNVPIPAIDAVTAYYPAQAAILISRHPLQESRGKLETWAAGQNSTSSDPILARVATMMIAKDPDTSTGYDWDNGFDQRGFVATVVAQSEDDVFVNINKTGTPLTELAGNACGDWIPRAPLAGWPKVYSYMLEENDSTPRGSVLVDLAGDQITSWRFDERSGSGSCHFVQRLNRYNRHQLLAYWLGIPDEQMPWTPWSTYAIKWTGKAAYERKLAKIVEAERRKLQSTVDALRQKGLLTDGGTDNVIPKLVLTIHCDIKPCPLH